MNVSRPPPPGGGGGPPNPPGMPTLTTLQSDVALYGYPLLYILAIVGHTSSLLIFLRPTLRHVSTSCLFIALTISDSVYLLVSIYDFINTGFRRPDSSADPSATCRLRTFVQSTFMCCNAWLLVTISADRWARVRFPFKSKQKCTRRNALLVIIGILIAAAGLNGHFLVPQIFGRLPAGVMTVCGASMVNPNYFQFFRRTWPILFSCLQTLIPVILLLIFSLDTFRRLARNSIVQDRARSRRRAYLDKQMLLIMLTSITLFAITTVPVGLYNILQPTVLRSLMTQTQQLELFSICTFVAGISYTIGFYLHCLTSPLFRQEFMHVIKWGRSRGRVVPITETDRMTGTVATVTRVHK
ncbi:unnamed protein product [Didymodactylos carnosus]|uniref:G-protein coupled receptors family 1 profile domain-containing protein n=1 Tax=Didymodactylos carnosus TaxID=1234261 RepID=A0A814XJV0_9BILA|nr:unnamed protein product [Didymodactylos carnosus]CAF3980636.1 unnamed protein product [Didymodactylos carnosus]